MVFREINSKITSIDFVGTNPQLFIDGNSIHKTFAGGIYSILVSLCTVLLIIYFGREIWEKKNPVVNRSLEPTIDPNKIVLDKINWDFFFGLQYYNVLYIDNSIYTIKGRLWTNTNEKGLYFEEFNIEPCTLDSFHPALSYLFSNYRYSGAWCVSKNNTGVYTSQKDLDGNYLKNTNNTTSMPIQINKLWGQNNFNFIDISIWPCSNKTSNVVCSSKEDIHKKLKLAVFSIYTTNYFIQTRNYTNPYIVNIYNDFIPVSYNTLVHSILYMQNSITNTDKGWLFAEDILENKFTIEKLKLNYYLSSDADGRFVRFQFQLSNSNETYYRKYMKIQELLAQIGGIAKFLLIIGFAFNQYTSDFYLKEYLVNLFFDYSDSDEDNKLDKNQNFNKMLFKKNTSLRLLNLNSNTNQCETKGNIGSNKMKLNNLDDLNSNENFIQDKNNNKIKENFKKQKKLMNINNTEMNDLIEEDKKKNHALDKNSLYFHNKSSKNFLEIVKNKTPLKRYRHIGSNNKKKINKQALKSKSFKMSCDIQGQKNSYFNFSDELNKRNIKEVHPDKYFIDIKNKAKENPINISKNEEKNQFDEINDVPIYARNENINATSVFKSRNTNNESQAKLSVRDTNKQNNNNIRKHVRQNTNNSDIFKRNNSYSSNPIIIDNIDNESDKNCNANYQIHSMIKKNDSKNMEALDLKLLITNLENKGELENEDLNSKNASHNNVSILSNTLPFNEKEYMFKGIKCNNDFEDVSIVMKKTNFIMSNNDHSGDQSNNQILSPLKINSMLYLEKSDRKKSSVKLTKSSDCVINKRLRSSNPILINSLQRHSPLSSKKKIRFSNNTLLNYCNLPKISFKENEYSYLPQNQPHSPDKLIFKNKKSLQVDFNEAQNKIYSSKTNSNTNQINSANSLQNINSNLSNAAKARSSRIVKIPTSRKSISNTKRLLRNQQSQNNILNNSIIEFLNTNTTQFNNIREFPKDIPKPTNNLIKFSFSEICCFLCLNSKKHKKKFYLDFGFNLIKKCMSYENFIEITRTISKIRYFCMSTYENALFDYLGNPILGNNMFNENNHKEFDILSNFIHTHNEPLADENLIFDATNEDIYEEKSNSKTINKLVEAYETRPCNSINKETRNFYNCRTITANLENTNTNTKIPQLDYLKNNKITSNNALQQVSSNKRISHVENAHYSNELNNFLRNNNANERQNNEFSCFNPSRVSSDGICIKSHHKNNNSDKIKEKAISTFNPKFSNKNINNYFHSHESSNDESINRSESFQAINKATNKNKINQEKTSNKINKINNINIFHINANDNDLKHKIAATLSDKSGNSDNKDVGKRINKNNLAINEKDVNSYSSYSQNKTCKIEFSELPSINKEFPFYNNEDK